MWSSLRTKRKDRIRGSDKPKKRGRSLVRILAAVLVLFLFPVTSFASNSGNAGSGTGRHDGNVFTFYYDYDANQDAIVLTVRTTHPTNTYGRKTSHTYSYTDKTNVPSNSPHIAAGYTMADAMAKASAKWNVSGWETALGQPSTTVDGQISGYERGGDQNQIWYVKGNHSRILTFFSLSGKLSPARTVVRQQDWTCTQDGYTQWSDGSYTDQVRHPGHIESSWQDGGADHYKYCTRGEHGCGHSILSREKHHFGSWTDSGIDHYRTCKDCRHVERGNHSYNAWKDDPDRPGWQKHTCVDCGHPEWRDIEPPTVSVSANPSGKWTAGDVTVTIKAKDRGSGLSSVLLYRTNTLDKTTSCVKTYSFKGQTDEQTCSFTETNEGRFTYYAIASDKSNNKKQSDPTKEAMLDHSDPKQTVFIGGQSTKTETRQGTKKVYQPGAKKTVTETKDVPKVPVYEDATSQINGAGKAVKYNNITYELNGGEATGNTPSDYIHGTETKIGNAKRTGYTFAGWIVTCDGQKLNSTPAKDVVIGSKSTGDLAFSAQWSTIYGIKFDSGADDAAGTMDPIPIGTIQKGQSYTLPKNKFSRTGYTFAGWNDQPDGSGKTYTDGATVKDLVNQTGVYAALYAEWKPITYKISYDLNGGSISGQPTSYTYGSTTYIPQPSRSGYVFAGWIINGGDERYANVTIGSNHHENVSLSASWKKIEAKDERVFTGANGTTATIRYITDHNGYTYQPLGNYWAYEHQAMVMKSWLIFIELPQGDNNSEHKVGIATHFNDGNGHQKNLVWTFYDEGTKLTFVGSPVNTLAQQQYRHYFPDGWEFDGKHYDYAHYIYWFDDDTHLSYNDDYNNGSLIAHAPIYGPMYWDWVYTYHPMGYYRYIESDCYAVDANGNRTSALGFRYRLLGYVLFDENNGTGKSSKQGYQFGMDIIDPSTKSMNLGDRNIAAPTKTGATFLGWGTEKDSSTIYSKWNWNPYPYCDNADDTMTLYAQWMNNSVTL